MSRPWTELERLVLVDSGLTAFGEMGAIADILRRKTADLKPIN